MTIHQVVEGDDTDAERVVFEAETFRATLRYVSTHYSLDEIDEKAIGFAKVLPYGTRVTGFAAC